MSNDAKFRAWDDFNKVMKYYTLEQLAGHDQFGVDTEYEAIQSGFNNWKWMQWVGLKDRIGKEIYEGDLLQHPSTNKLVLVTKGLTGWIFICDGKQIEYSIQFKVYANICENKELVTGLAA